MLDPATLLCERCGYVIEGLPETGHCPECGKPISESLPERRTGSAWQNAPGFRASLRVCLKTLWSPRSTFAQVRFDSPADQEQPPAMRWQLQFTAGAIALVPPLGFVVAIAFGISNIPLHVLLFAAVILLVPGCALVSALGMVGLDLLTLIERRGIQFFGRRRAWRVTLRIADVICSHACVGWVAGACISAAFFLGGVVTAALTDAESESLQFAATLSMSLGPIIGFLVGMLWFETLVWLGIRRCRFANQARTTAPHRQTLTRPSR